MHTSIPNISGEPDRRLRMPEVRMLTGLSKRTIYRRVEEEKLAKPGKDGRVTFWWLSDIKKYMGINNGGQTT